MIYPTNFVYFLFSPKFWLLRQLEEVWVAKTYVSIISSGLLLSNMADISYQGLALPQTHAGIFTYETAEHFPAMSQHRVYYRQ